ncbi:Fc.00g096500.m01.CDS01 [Cosmosporella sp. VM-42]
MNPPPGLTQLPPRGPNQWCEERAACGSPPDSSSLGVLTPKTNSGSSDPPPRHQEDSPQQGDHGHSLPENLDVGSPAWIWHVNNYEVESPDGTQYAFSGWCACCKTRHGAAGIVNGPVLRTRFSMGTFKMLITHDLNLSRQIDLTNEIHCRYQYIAGVTPTDAVCWWIWENRYARHWDEEQVRGFWHILLVLEQRGQLTTHEKITTEALRDIKIDNIRFSHSRQGICYIYPQGVDQPKWRKADFDYSEQKFIDTYYPGQFWALNRDNIWAMRPDEMGGRYRTRCPLRIRRFPPPFFTDVVAEDASWEDKIFLSDSWQAAWDSGSRPPSLTYLQSLVLNEF